MRVRIEKSALHGRVSAVASKSYAHRAVICASLSDKPSRIICSAGSEDISATIACMKALGAKISLKGDVIEVQPVSSPEDGARLDCGESGSTLRFLLPVVCALGVNASFTGHGRLPERPLSPLRELLLENGIRLSEKGRLPLECSGLLEGGDYSLPADVSSQFVSGLLMALPLASRDSTLTLTGRVESGPYIDMTVQVMRDFGIEVEREENVFHIGAAQRYVSPGEFTVEGDWSNAAFWLCAGALGNNIEVENLNTASIQGDRAVMDILRAFGAEVKFGHGAVSVRRKELRGIEVDAGNIPDLVPVLAAVAATAEGETVFKNAGRLRIKESDRLLSVRQTLNLLGADVRETEDALVVSGGRALSGGSVSSFNDHRIAMTAAILACVCDNGSEIDGAEAVKKSYPGFYEDLASLGGAVYVEEDGIWVPVTAKI